LGYIALAECVGVSSTTFTFYVIGPKSYRFRRNNAIYTAITPFKVIQGHRLWYQMKAHMRLPISDY